MANIIEVVLEAKEKGAEAFDKFAEKLDAMELKSNGLSKGLLSVGVAAAAGYASFKLFEELSDKIIEAQYATARLDAAFKATGDTLGYTRKQLDEIAESLNKTTTYDDDTIKASEALLLSFDKIRGEGFQRVLKDAADLAARLGTDLPNATELLARAIQNPELAFRSLRSAGISFTDAQKEMIIKAKDAGDYLTIENIILGELERKAGGAAGAVRETLGGALKALKNTFGDLFKGTTDGTSSAVSAIDKLNVALANPKLKSSIDTLIAGLATIVSKIVSIGTGIASIITTPVKGSVDAINKDIASLQKSLDDIEIKHSRAGTVRVEAPGNEVVSVGRSKLTVDDVRKAIEDLIKKRDELMNPKEIKADNSVIIPPKVITEIDEFKTSLQEVTSGPLDDFYDQLDKLTKTDVESQFDSMNEKLAALQIQLADGKITQGIYDIRKAAAMDTVPEFKIDVSKIDLEKTKTDTDKYAEAIKGIWQGVGQSIQHSLADAFYNSSISLKSFTDIFRRAMAEITSAVVINNLKKILDYVIDINKEKDSSGGSGSSSSGFWGTIASGVIKAFSAGGGTTFGPTVVGEEGPEIVTPTGQGGIRTYNQRELAFGGAGSGALNYAPVYNMPIQGARDDKEIYNTVFDFVSRKSEQDKAEIYRTMYKNGLGRMR